MLKRVVNEGYKLLTQHFLKFQFVGNPINEKKRKMDGSSFQLSQIQYKECNKQNQNL